MVGDVGFYIPYGEEMATVKAIKRALELSTELGKKSRERIMHTFPLDKRANNLKTLIMEYV